MFALVVLCCDTVVTPPQRRNSGGDARHILLDDREVYHVGTLLGAVCITLLRWYSLEFRRRVPATYGL